MKQLKSIMLGLGIVLCLSSCYTTTHTVGNGGTGRTIVKESQWYALWGLVPIKPKDSKAMVGSADNYTITTKHTFVDQLISMFTNIATISRQTIEVSK